MIKLNEKKDIYVIRDEANYDRACDSAWRTALHLFGINENGHSTDVEDWERSYCSLNIKFIQYSRSDSTHLYTFEAWAEKSEDEDEDDN